MIVELNYRKVIQVFLLSLFCFCSLNLFAQQKFKSQTQVGINQGLSIGMLLFDPQINMTPVFGYQGGIVFRHLSEPRMGLQVELNFSQRGWAGVVDSIFNYERNLSYLELPFMTNISFGKSNNQFILNFGPKISYYLSDKITGDLSSEQQALQPQLQALDNKALVGVCIGLGYSRTTKIGVFQFEARYNQGISNIFNDGSEDVFFHSKNIPIGVGLVYLKSLNSEKETFED